MSTNGESDLIKQDNKILTDEERALVKRKVKWNIFKSQVGIPLIGIVACFLLSGLANLLLPVNENGKDNIIVTLFNYAAAFSILWLIKGIFIYLKFTSMLGEKKGN